MRLDAIIGMENKNDFTFKGSVARMSLFTGTFYTTKEFIKKGPMKHEELRPPSHREDANKQFYVNVCEQIRNAGWMY